MSEESIAIRLKFLIENLGLTSSQFADKCDIARPTLSQLLTGRNKKISNLIIEQIHAAYPGLSVLWLLFGEGDMWASTKETGSNKNSNLFDGKVDFSHKDSLNYVENPNENKDISTTGLHLRKEDKENAVNLSQNATVNSDYENVNDTLKNIEFLTKLEKKYEKSRKVVQVTIYYDDSTFQTFYPK